MNIDRMTLPIDDKKIQNQVKLQLLEAIILDDVLEFGVENVVCDAWDEKENMMGKAFTGERVLRIRIMAKEKE